MDERGKAIAEAEGYITAALECTTAAAKDDLMTQALAALARGVPQPVRPRPAGPRGVVEVA